MSNDEVISALRRAPGFHGATEARVTISRLGGLTNRVFHVAFEQRAVVVRLAGEGTEAYIDRTVERVNAEAAHRAGVAPAIVLADAGCGLLITEAIENITTMTAEGFRTREGSPARAGQALSRLHRSGETFEFRFELFAMIEEYLKILEGRTVELPEGYSTVVEAATPVREALQTQSAALAPCHCDPLCENFLDDGERMWIVDWEYSGMNDPLWDLGDLSVEASMDATQEAQMLNAYFGRTATAAEQGRVVLYKAMCDLLWTLWGLIQHADQNPAEDFMAYATERFERCRTLMAEAQFDSHVAAVKAG